MVLPHHDGILDDRTSLLEALRRAWPPSVPSETRGYRPLDLQGTQAVAALDLGQHRAVVVVRHRQGPPTALPCRRTAGRWAVASAGDGLAASLISRLRSGTDLADGDFALEQLRPRPVLGGAERELGTDQSNISVVVDDAAIVKWRSAPDADGRRAQRLRRHLQATGFGHSPALLASLSWTDEAGETWVLADVDAFLPEAADGWDDAIDRLIGELRGPGPLEVSYAERLGRLAAELHAALLTPSAIIPQPIGHAGPAEMAAILAGGRRLLERALAIEAPEQDEVIARGPVLAAALEQLPREGALLGPIHGDLHLGQLVAWRDGLDVIDFDGAPEPVEPAGDRGVPARDVVQMLCSLWNLAAVVDARTAGTEAARLRSWATAAETAFLEAYRSTPLPADASSLDRRLIEPFMAEQLCRELIYADTTLPRWRYAPLQALRWRYPLEAAR